MRQGIGRVPGVALLAVALLMAVGVEISARTSPAVAEAPSVVPTVDLGDQSGLERDAVTGSVFVPVTLSRPSDEPVVVSFHTIDGTAVAGTDYLRWGTPNQPRTVTIPAGRLQTTINVPVLWADTAPVDRQFGVVATAVTGGGAVLGDDSAVATIVDSDAVAGPNPALAVSQPAITEGHTGQRLMQVQIHLSRPTSSPLTLTYATRDGTAQSGADYVAKLPGTVVLAQGQISKTVDVLVNADEVVGTDRSFEFEVAVVGGPPVEELSTLAVATIREDDVAAEPEAVQVGAGSASSCALLDDGTVQCWGQNSSGQLGNGTTVRSSVPVAVEGLTDAVAVSAGSQHACVVRDGGAVACWGRNVSGQLGDGSTVAASAPVPVALPGPAAAVAAGDNHTCALLVDGSAQCWGQNLSGELGNASTVNSVVPVGVAGLAGAVALSAGGSHSCAVLADGGVRCWGAGGSGRLGNGATSNSTTPVAVSGMLDAEAVSTGGSHTCAVRSGGSMSCWGDNSSAQLGAGATAASSTTPVVVSSGGVSQADAGAAHGCSVGGVAAVSCWGSNGSGQIGNGLDGQPSTVPVATSVAGPVTEVDAGGDLFGHACAAASSGAAFCWGYGGQYGQLGNGSSADAPTPTPVTGLSDVVQIGTGADRSCALLADGTVRCWGMVLYDSFLDLTGRSNGPVSVPGLTDVTQISVGLLHACALRSDGTVWCWGTTFDGRLGTTFSQSYQPTPVQVPGLVGVQQVTAGNGHSCALLADGTARCWGSNSSGALGAGTIGGSSAVPQAVVGLTGVTQLSPLCAVGAGGAVSCWGTGSGTPAAVPGLTDAVRVDSQTTHSCAVLADGTARCWGSSNTKGQLGNGTTTASATPVVVSGLTGATDVTVGADLSCAVVAGGDVRCWGDNSRGSLGNGGTTAPTPVAVVGLP